VSASWRTGLSALAFIIIPENNYKELKQSLNPSRSNIQKSKFILHLCKSPARGMQAKNPFACSLQKIEATAWFLLPLLQERAQIK
jgi:hypothetical protein